MNTLRANIDTAQAAIDTAEENLPAAEQAVADIVHTIEQGVFSSVDHPDAVSKTYCLVIKKNFF